MWNNTWKIHLPQSTALCRQLLSEKKHTLAQNSQANWRRDVIAAVVFVCRPTFCRKESKKHTIIPTTKNWPSAVGHANRKVGHSSDTRHDSKQIRIDVTWRDAFLSSAKTPQKIQRRYRHNKTSWNPPPYTNHISALCLSRSHSINRKKSKQSKSNTQHIYENTN